MERPRTSPRNLAHRMGRWSGLHPWRAIFAWIAFVAVCFAAGNAIGTTKVDENTSGPGESGRAARMLDQAGFNDQPATELVFVQARRGRLSDGTLHAVDRDVRARLGSVADVTAIKAPERSGDGRSAKIEFSIRGTADTASA